MVDRIHKKLAGWKSLYLSNGGRLNLIKAVMAFTLIYFMSLFVIPGQVVHKIERM